MEEGREVGWQAGRQIWIQIDRSTEKHKENNRTQIYRDTESDRD